MIPPEAGQRAVLALDLLPHFEVEAAERRRATQNNNAARAVPERIPEQGPTWKGDAREQAADAVGVNPRYVSDAKRIKAEAPELAEKLKAGELSVPAALRQLADDSAGVRRHPRDPRAMGGLLGG